MKKNHREQRELHPYSACRIGFFGKIGRWMGRVWSLPCSALAALLFGVCWMLLAAVADTSGAARGAAFEDVSDRAGVGQIGRSYGVAVGDANGDGWPDIWDTNHQDMPALYLNQRDGTFENAAGRLEMRERGDQHGSAWADFDNDGDQDLIVAAGGKMGQAESGFPNLLYINEEGQFVERGTASGVDYPLGRGRNPLWLDYDNDGDLDLVFFNEARPDGLAPSALFQNNGAVFSDASQQAGFEFDDHATFGVVTNLVGAQNPLLLIVRNAFPPAVYAVGTTFQRLHGDMEISPYYYVGDMVVADFDGDLDADIFLARINDYQSEALLVDDYQLRVIFKGKGSKNEINQGIAFAAAGAVTFDMYGPFLGTMPTDTIHIGAGDYHPPGQMFTLDAADPATHGLPVYRPGVDDGMYLGYDPDRGVWQLFCSTSSDCWAQVVIQSSGPISNLQALGFSLEATYISDVYLEQVDGVFVDASARAGFSAPTGCASVVAADFDNDMDLDIYQLCRRSVTNIANMLYENQGDGTFVSVPGAGGATGSAAGIAKTVVTLDYDLDGFVDLYFNNGKGFFPYNQGPHQLLRNLGNENNWVEIKLAGTRSNRDAVGAVVYVTAGGVTQVREQNGGMHNAAQNQQELHFGLGEQTSIEKIEIHWPSGIAQRIHNAPVNQRLTLVEQEPLLFLPYVSAMTGAQSSIQP